MHPYQPEWYDLLEAVHEEAHSQDVVHQTSEHVGGKGPNGQPIPAPSQFIVGLRQKPPGCAAKGTQQNCQPLASPAFRELGIYRQHYQVRPLVSWQAERKPLQRCLLQSSKAEQVFGTTAGPDHSLGSALLKGPA